MQWNRNPSETQNATTFKHKINKILRNIGTYYKEGPLFCTKYSHYEKQPLIKNNMKLKKINSVSKYFCSHRSTKWVQFVVVSPLTKSASRKRFFFFFVCILAEKSFVSRRYWALWKLEWPLSTFFLDFKRTWYTFGKWYTK